MSKSPQMIPPEMLIEAYCSGIFPMAMDDGGIGWFSPDPRAIIPLEDFHVPHGLKRALRKNIFEIRIDTAFAKVMRECAAREETWISEDIIGSYCELHRRGYAHSVEAWKDGKLAGGLYGVSLGAVFFGESMFHHATDASKVALCALVERMLKSGFKMLEVQWVTPHLQAFGAIEIPRDDYLKRLRACLKVRCEFPAK
ncbi:MAG TPA: leucyl/phenylalanyl-tRNA--protein transferase [Chthoniobacteraceae bacterium]|nr:leucyl/phenylalanyl-tRNA--protein transferase [Chthoniobacteraceae bacterium]